MASTFAVLAEPARRDILVVLRGGEQSVGELVERTNLSQPGMSKHLRVLREAGLVEVRHDAQRRWYRLRIQPLHEIEDWLAPFRDLWSEQLDALERHLDAGTTTTGTTTNRAHEEGHDSRNDRQHR